MAAVLLAAAVLAAGWKGLPLLRYAPERGWEPWRDLQIARSMLPLQPSQRDYAGPGYARDRDYAAFLWTVQASHGDARRFLLLTADLHDWYRYRAAYLLAPVPVEAFDPAAAQDGTLLVWRAPVPAGWTEVRRWQQGAVCRRSGAP